MSSLGNFFKYFFFPPALIYDAITGKGSFERNTNNNNNNTNNNSTTNSTDSASKEKVKNVYNYYGLDDSNTGNVLFNSQKKKRNIFQDENNTQINQVNTTRRFI